MALTDQQLADTRYYMGYSVAGNSTASPFRELAYSDVSYMGLSLDYRLADLADVEEARLTGFFLLNLALREAEVQAAAANLGTASASVWTHNKNEIAERRGLYTALRLELCRFLGFPPGSGLAQTGNQLLRS